MPKSRSFAIVPAAGRSRRMGQDKLLMPWGDVTVIESLLANWKASCVDEIVVVCRADQFELQSLCCDVSVVVPDMAPPEMKDSVLAALNHIRDKFSPYERDAWLLAPADMPQLNASVIDALVKSYDSSASEIIVPICDGKRGHPVLFSWSLASAVSELDEDKGVNALLEKYRVRELACNAGEIHGDLDTPEDYERLRTGSNIQTESQRRNDD